jgi:hypothetical protein
MDNVKYVVPEGKGPVSKNRDTQLMCKSHRTLIVEEVDQNNVILFLLQLLVQIVIAKDLITVGFHGFVGSLEQRQLKPVGNM